MKCKRCSLHRRRKNIVWGEGPEDAEIFFIGEAPGAREDEQGRPFVGDAGRILTELLKEAGYEREEVYITNVVKCRPPGNREPFQEEIDACSSYLEKQLSKVKPKIVVTLGRIAAQRILGKNITLSTSHGMVFSFPQYKVLVTYHPAACLYGRNTRSKMEKDFKKLRNIVSNEVLNS
jgi:DNA polymerase